MQGFFLAPVRASARERRADLKHIWTRRGGVWRWPIELSNVDHRVTPKGFRVGVVFRTFVTASRRRRRP